MEELKAKLKTEVIKLYQEGVEFLRQEVEGKQTSSSRASQKKSPQEENTTKKLPFLMGYQQWYSKCLPVVRQLLPERYVEFQEQYKLDKRKEIDFLTYTISDYLIGLSVKRYGEEIGKSTLRTIIKISKSTFDSVFSPRKSRLDT